jgi:hypothetical protein
MTGHYLDPGGLSMFRRKAEGVHHHAVPAPERDLLRRVAAHFEEMPGLRLTLPQAVRLLGLEPGRCEQILRHLVGEGVLRTNGRVFARA